MIDKVIQHIDANRKASVDRLNEFLRIPSISTDPERKADTRLSSQLVYKKVFTRHRVVQPACHSLSVANQPPGLGLGFSSAAPGSDFASFASPALPVESTVTCISLSPAMQ